MKKRCCLLLRVDENGTRICKRFVKREIIHLHKNLIVIEHANLKFKYFLNKDSFSNGQELNTN